MTIFTRIVRNVCTRPMLFQTGRHIFPNWRGTVPRYVCAKSLLKLDLHEEEIKRFRSRVQDTDGFWLRIFSMQQEQVVLEEDLKMAWFLANDDFLPDIIQLTEKFMNQIRTNVFTFRLSPIMMRACYRLHNSDAALQIFHNPHISKHMTDAMSIIILLDLLIDDCKFEEAVSVVDELKRREWFFILRNPVVAVMYVIALNKIGSQEALSKACEFSSKMPLSPARTRTIINVMYLLALKLRDGKLLSEMSKRSVNSQIEWNMKIQALALMSCWENVSREINHRHYKLFKDTYELIKTGNPKLCETLSRATERKLEDEIYELVKLDEFKDALLSQPKNRFYS